jgi:hypothetical protein
VETSRFQLNLLLGLLLLVLLAAHYNFVSRFALDFPIADDGSDILLSTLDAHKAQSAGEVLRVIFRQHTAHITAFNKSVAMSYHLLFGELNFRHLIFFGNSLVVLTAMFLIYLLRGSREFHLAAAIVLLIVLHPRSWASHQWAITSLSNFGVWVFGFSSLYLALHRPDLRRYAATAILLASCASFTLGNGLLTLPLLAVIFLLRCETPQDKLTWAALCLVLTAVYFQLLSPQDGAIADLRRESLAMALARPDRALLHGAAITGTFFSSNPLAATIAGLVGLAYLAWRLLGILRKDASISLWLLLFTALSIAAITANRLAFQASADSSTIVRYYYYSQLFWAVLFVDAYPRLLTRSSELRRRAVLSGTAIIAALLLWQHYDKAYPEAELRYEVHSTLMQQLLLEDPDAPTQERSFILSLLAVTLAESREAGVYDPAAALRLDTPREAAGDTLCHDSADVASRGSISLRNTQLPGVTRLELRRGEPGLPQRSELILCRDGQASIFEIGYRQQLLEVRELLSHQLREGERSPDAVLLTRADVLAKPDAAFLKRGKRRVMRLRID